MEGEVNKKEELKECGWRGEEEVINEAAIITEACLRQLWKTTHIHTHNKLPTNYAHLSTTIIYNDCLKCGPCTLTNDTSFFQPIKPENTVVTKMTFFFNQKNITNANYLTLQGLL